MALKIAQHPAKRWNRIEQKWEPTFPDDRSVWDDNKLLGYCSTIDDRPLNLIYPKLSESEKAAVVRFVEEQLCVKVRMVSVSPIVPEEILNEEEGTDE